jgi:UDP-N-acetylglucosamine 2-epimerase
MAEFGLGNLQSEIRNLKFIEPVGYLDMLMLEQNARLILTDSGGMQKEAYFFGVPCVTLREETEWVETVEAGWNVLVGSNPARIVVAVRELAPLGEPAVIFGDGRASEKMAEILSQSLFLARDTFCARAFRVVRDQPARAAEDSVKRG